ncbi:MAG TPA: methyltransferase domain-containing protein [Syntrophales bacterium]|nr:methyltransferase domain-containing protein [Syntrophales bacterium]
MKKTAKKLLWKIFSQSGELDFHKNNKWRQSADFMKQTDYLFRLFGYQPDSFKDKFVIDIGSGSKLRSKFFTGSKIIAIEPLADSFVKELSWSDLKDAHKFFSSPAEEFHNELSGTGDFVMCINVLDHVIDPEDIFSNCQRYLKNGGEFLLSVDFHKGLDLMHPVKLNEEYINKMAQKYKFTLSRKHDGLGSYGKCYGKGTAHTYIFKKS